jgi:hypothetical protein
MKMKQLMKSIGHLGNIVMKNKGKVLLSLGAIALAPALRWAAQKYLELKEEVAEEEEETLSPPKPRRNKREIYHAPKVPPENLVRH